MRSKLTTEVGRRILHAVGTFGAYLVDDAAGGYMGKDGKTNINYEQGVAEEVMANYGLILGATPDTQGGVLYVFLLSFVPLITQVYIKSNT